MSFWATWGLIIGGTFLSLAYIAAAIELGLRMDRRGSNLGIPTTLLLVLLPVSALFAWAVTR